MEYLLIELFGGGTADWEMIGETQYVWHDIVQNLLMRFDFKDIGFCDFLVEIFEMARKDFCRMIDKFINENRNNEEYKDIINKLKKVDFTDDSIWYENVNYLDNDLVLTVDEEMSNILEQYFEDEIDKINDNIGFNYIQINVE